MMPSRLLWLVLLPLCACAASLRERAPNPLDDELIMRDDYSFKGQGRLNPAQVRHDLALLRYVLSTGYGGRGVIDPELMRGVLERLDGIAQQAEPISSAQLCDGLAQALFAIPDNHISVMLPPHDECTDKLRREPPEVGRNLAKQTQVPWEINEVRVKDEVVPVLSITSFPDREDPSWKGMTEAVAKAKAEAPAIIIDLRGNGGGDNGKAAEVARILYGQPFPHPEMEQVITQSPAGVALSANRSKPDLIFPKREGLAPEAYAVKAFAEEEKRFDLARRGRLDAVKVIPAGGRETLDPRKLYSGPIYILVDQRCSSSCESMLEMFEAHPRAVTVGDHTSGTIHFCPQGHLVLPNSQVWVSMGFAYNRYRDSRFIERKGYAPKVRVPPGEDALQATLKLLGSAPRTAP